MQIRNAIKSRIRSRIHSYYKKFFNYIITCKSEFLS